MTLTTYALWGTGELDPRQAQATLSTYIHHPDLLGFVYRPERVGREARGLRTAIDWFESPDFAGKDATTPSTDLLESLKAARDSEGDTVYLLALWPEAPTREDFAYVRTFEAEGIVVCDLSRAMDDLDLSLYTEPPPPKEPKAAKPKAPSRSRKISDPEPEFVSPTLMDAANELVVTTEPLVCFPEEEVNLEAAMVALFGVEQARMIDDYINYKLRRAMVHRTEPIAGVRDQVAFGLAHIRDTYGDDPPFDGPYVDESTVEYYSDRDRNIRPAEGKPRRGEFTVRLGPLELEVAQREGRYRG